MGGALSRPSFCIGRFLSSKGIVRSQSRLPVALPHNKVYRAKNCYHVADHVTRQDLWQNTDIDETRGPNFQAIRNTAALAADIKTQLSLGILRAKVDLADWRVNALRHQYEMVNELLHFGEDVNFWRKRLLGIDIIDRPGRKLLDDLLKDAHALSHFLHADKIAIEGIAYRPYRNLEVVVLVVEVRMLAADVVLDTRAAQVWTGNARKRSRPPSI